MSEAGNDLNDNPNLSFHADLISAAKQLQSRDLAIAQGVLQYAGDPTEFAWVLPVKPGATSRFAIRPLVST